MVERHPVKDYGIKFHPKAGQILICDFRGYEIPEIVKRRPVVVISNALSHRPGLVTIVPISTVEPDPVMPWHYILQNVPEFPSRWGKKVRWVKCDLVYNVRLARLDRFKTGRRQYKVYKTSAEELENIRRGVLAGLGFQP